MLGTTIVTTVNYKFPSRKSVLLIADLCCNKNLAIHSFASNRNVPLAQCWRKCPSFLTVVDEVFDNVFYLFIAKNMINLILFCNGIQILIQSKKRMMLWYGKGNEKHADLHLWKWIFLSCAQHCLQVTFKAFESRTFCIWHVVKSCHSLCSIVFCKLYWKCDCIIK